MANSGLTTTLGTTGVAVVALVVIFGGLVNIPAGQGAEEFASGSDCVSAQPGADDGQGQMAGIHPIAASALRRAGITESMITQGRGFASASGGTHGPIAGSTYGGAADIRTRDMSDATIKQTLHNLRMQGFAAWYREPGWEGKPDNAHIHAAYAGLKGPYETKSFQITTFINSETRRRNGLGDGGGRNPSNFPLDSFPTAEEIASVKSVYEGGSGCSGGGGAPAAFFAWLGPLAATDDSISGIPGSVTAGQAAYESGYASSSYAIRGRNLFGIKCNTLGKTAGCTGDYAAYLSYADSIKDHSRVLSVVTAYRDAWQYKNKSDKASSDLFLTVIAPHYAPPSESQGNRDYVPAVLGIMRKYNLYQYDR